MICYRTRHTESLCTITTQHTRPTEFGLKESPLMQREKITSPPCNSGCWPYKECAPCLSSLNKSVAEHLCRWIRNRTWRNTCISFGVIVGVAPPRFIVSNKWTRNDAGRKPFKQAWTSGTSVELVALIPNFLRAAPNVKLMSNLARLKSLVLTPFTESLTAAIASAKW